MKKQIRFFLASAIIMGLLASCEQSEVNDLEIQDVEATENEVGGGHGGDDPDPEGN